MGDNTIDRELNRLWRVSRTVHEMARDRGFAVSDEEINTDFESWKDAFARGGVNRDALNFYVSKPDDPADKIFVFYAEEKSVGVKTMRRFLETMDQYKVSVGIIIYQQSMTSSANKVIQALSNKYTLEAFQEAELLVNITLHDLVPNHSVMTPQEKKDLLAKYRLKETQLPRIQLSDPVARYYGLKRGQVVKIIRPSETSGRYASYRIAL